MALMVAGVVVLLSCRGHIGTTVIVVVRFFGAVVIIDAASIVATSAAVVVEAVVVDVIVVDVIVINFVFVDVITILFFVPTLPMSMPSSSTPSSCSSWRSVVALPVQRATTS